MKAALRLMGDYLRDWAAAWDRFWFRAVDPATLSLIRVCAGLMLLYTHLVWTLDLESFFGQESWLPRQVIEEVRREAHPWTAWSYFWGVESRAVLWLLHVAGLVVFALLTLGYRSRLMALLAYLVAVSYVGRASEAWFGLDKINCMLAMYLMLGPCGARYSLDRLRVVRGSRGDPPPVAPSVSANVALRLMQLHLCIVYLFSGLGKLQGQTWWDGTAVWWSVANAEYQSWDLTWLAGWPGIVALLTHVTVFWELFYVALVWPRLTRPVVLLLAVCVHGGIALFLGMATFGLAMLIANLAFVAPELVRAVCDPPVARLAIVGKRQAAPEAQPVEAA